MKKNKIKIQYEYFAAVLDGTKKAEWRKNDRDYKVGDEYTLCELDKDGKETGRTIDISITHIVYGGKFEMPSDYCMFSFMVIGQPSEKEQILNRALMQMRDLLSSAKRELCDYETTIKVLARMALGGEK